MTNKISFSPINILNVKGVNTAILSGNLPIFNDSADIAINVTVTRENPADIETNASAKALAQTVNGNFNTTVIIKRADLPEVNEAAIKAIVLKELNVSEVVEAKK